MRVRPSTVTRALLAALAVLGFASAAHADALASAALAAPGLAVSGAADNEDRRAAPGSFCTFSQCRPRSAEPLRDAAAFGAVALGASLLARRRSPRA